jgi:FkbM family methyltransferase
VSSQSSSLPRRALSVLRERGPRTFLEAAGQYATGAVVAPWWQYRYGLDAADGFEAAASDERPVFADLFANLRPDDVFYDVGAHVGLFTRPVAKLLPEGTVVAFEPGEGADELRRSLDDSNVVLVEEAISRTAGEGYHSHNGRVGLLGNDDADAFRTTNAREILDEGTLPLPNVVKIDVFGAEVDVVEGLEELLQRDECRLVYCEVHLPTTFQRKRPDDVFEEYLDSWSFTDLVRVFYRCGFEVEPMYLRRDTHDVFLKAYRAE